MFDFDVRAGHDAPPTTEMPPGIWPETLERVSRLRGFGPDLSQPVTKVPRRSPVVLAPSCGLRAAFRLMSHRHAAAALVASHGVLVGILGEREITLRMLDPDAPTGDLPVSRVMAPDPETLIESDTVAYAVRKLWMLGGRPMPILRTSGALVGLLETQDVVAWLCAQWERQGAGQPAGQAPNLW